MVLPAGHLEQCLVRVGSPFFLTPPALEEWSRLHEVTQLCPLKGQASISWREFSRWLMTDLLSLCLCFPPPSFKRRGLKKCHSVLIFSFSPQKLGHHCLWPWWPRLSSQIGIHTGCYFVYSTSDWRGNTQDHKYNLLQKATLFLVSTRGTLFIIIHFTWA